MNLRDFDIGVFHSINSTYYNFFWILAIVGILTITLAKINNTSYISGLFQFSKNFNQNNLSSKSLSAPLLLLNYLISISLLGYILIESLGLTINASQPKQIFSIFIGLLVFHLIKTGLQYIIANWFLRKDVFDIKNTLQQYQITGIILLPLAIFSVYQSPDFKFFVSILCMVILLISYLIFWYYSFKDSLQYKISLFYIFLYLCTLEILPFLLVAKFLLS